ncbi:pyruvate formate lyase family protein [Oscillospiraceae bacterium PP1C4]
MAKFNIDGIQNVEVSKKLPCQKSFEEQLQIMKRYTDTHRITAAKSKEEREVACLKVLYPTLFRQIEDTDRVAGRIDVLPIGFGCVTSLGGVGHYCVFNKLKQFKENFADAESLTQIDELYSYWVENDLKTKYCNDMLTDDTIGRFIDCQFPLIATARLSGMMLNYPLLLDNGIGGLREILTQKQAQQPDHAFYNACIECLDLFVKCAESLKQMALKQAEDAEGDRKKELLRMAEGLESVKSKKPDHFHEALQLFWLYAILAGVINYGRLDDYLGPYLKKDLDSGVLTEDEAYAYIKSLWTMIENRRTTVNGRIIVGGRGRRNPEAADVFLKLAMRVAKDVRYVEPQFTLRITKDMPEEIFDMAMETLGVGATYPTLYNDEVNIPAVMRAFRVDEKTAEQYVPFGCGEFVIAGQSTGTPNTCVNLLKLFTISLNKGVDPMDGEKKNGPIELLPASELSTFEMLYDQYKRLLDYYFDLSIKAQTYSYEVMSKEVSFLFTSILMDDCIGRGKAVLDGGVRYLGGTNETYGNINTSDALSAIKHFVYDTKKYTLSQLVQAANVNFKGYESIRKDLWNYDKYGNDIPEVDDLANDFYEFVANGIRNRGIDAGMQYYLIVISNNQLNTEWGRCTAASLDGRLGGTFMNPANNPQGGASRNGPTAVLNSLARFDAGLHGGSVQNIKFSTNFFRENSNKIKIMFKTYFKRGGCHIMVTVIDKGVLEKAVANPDDYRDLIVRVSGFSAVFVNLEPDVQAELMSRVMYN